MSRQAALAALRCMRATGIGRVVADSTNSSMNSLRKEMTPFAARVAESAPVFGSMMARTFASGGYLDKGEVTDRVLAVVKAFDKVSSDKITPSAAFQKDLGLDSLDTVELVMAIEEEFAIEIPDSEADKILSCDDAITYIASNPMAK